MLKPFLFWKQLSLLKVVLLVAVSLSMDITAVNNGLKSADNFPQVSTVEECYDDDGNKIVCPVSYS